MVIGNLHETFKKKIALIALFDDVNGLQVGNNIWFSGVKVGTVSKLEFVENSKVRVELKVEVNSVPFIRKDSFVKLSTDGLIGNKILVIYGGTATQPTIENGDQLGVEKTFTSEDMINTLQENNKNILAITNDLKVVSNDLSNGNGTIGKLLKDDELYNQLNGAGVSLNQASQKANEFLSSINAYSKGLNKKGSLANELVSDTVLFNSLKLSAVQFHELIDSASAFVSSVKESANSTNAPLGLLLNDAETGTHIKQTIINLESGSKKLDANLEALQHTFLFRRYFRKINKKSGK
jgi:phospholipid/cholesterol/gamma-HCH transport system substrate-binding protein